VTPSVLLDTGPLVAFLNRGDRHHGWARSELGRVTPPLLTCEAVVSEACFLLRRLPDGPYAVLELVRRGLLSTAFDLGREAALVQKLLARYAEVPMSLADACLVRLAEINPASFVLTLDSDFALYRMHGRQVIPVRMPGEVRAGRRRPRA
jgi:predicted nucleic acid-binding protein